MKAKVTLDVELPDIGATEEEAVEFIEYEFGYSCSCSIDNPFLNNEEKDYEVNSIEIEIL